MSELDQTADLTAEPPDGRSLDEVLRSVQNQTLSLLARLDRPPRSLRITAGDVTIEAKWPVNPQPPAPGPVREAYPRIEEPASLDQPVHLCSPMVGVFYRAPGVGAKPFVAEGDTVVSGQQVGIVEAMKLMVPVRADRAMTILEVLRPDGTPVEYGEPLFAIEPIDG